MKTFEYYRATAVDEAVARLGPGATVLAGGTNLVDLMKLGVATPDVLVDVNRLPLHDIEETGDGLVIGAGVRNGDLAADPVVRRDFPVLSQALLAGASGQLRNMATTAGNLMQRTRCRYFTDITKPCNKREPGTGCPAREGDHRNLAVLGASEACVATHPSDMAVALVALDATVRVTGPGGQRSIALADFHRLPGQEPQRDTVLDPGELITAVVVPPLAFGRTSMYRKARDRASYAFAAGSVAAALDLDGGTVRDVRLAFGAVAHKPWRAYAAEGALRGRPVTRESFLAAADAELAAAVPLRDNGFKVPELVRHGGDEATFDTTDIVARQPKDGRHAFGAHFAEVRVDADTGEVRVSRLFGMYGVGKVLNPRTARSQFIGGMTMGLGMALMEEGTLDPATGDWVNHDLAEYHVPVHADVESIDAAWLEETDPAINPMGSKGIGEIGIVGSPAAIVNAVWHATGIRIRDLPIRLDKLLPGLESAP